MMIANKNFRTLRQFSRWVLVLAVLIAFCFSAFFPYPIRAASPVYVNVAAPDGGDGLSWAHALNNLQDGINLAVSGEEIWVAAGTYHPTALTDPLDPLSATFYLKGGVAIYGGFNGTELTRAARDWELNDTILDGHITPAEGDPYQVYHVVRLSDSVNALTRLDGFTITGGNAVGSLSDRDYTAAGMEVFNSQITLENLIFLGNHSARDGGGLGMSNSAVTLESIQLINNTAGERGGGIFQQSAVNPSLTDVTFTGNVADGSGGGMFDAYNATVFTNVTFTDNIARASGSYGFGGGGLFSVDGSPVILNSAFHGNVAGTFGSGGTVVEPASGGAVLFSSASNARIEGSTFVNNQATTSGGAVDNYNSGTIIYNNTFTGNFASFYGGAIESTSSPTWMGENLFVGNHVDSMGGALSLSGLSTDTVTNSVFTGNYAAQGGAVAVRGDSATPFFYNIDAVHNSVGGSNPHGAGLIVVGDDGAETGHTTIVNGIFYYNTGADEDLRVYEATLNVSYTVAQYLSSGPDGIFTNETNMITTAPLFVDRDGVDNVVGTADDDFRLSSNSPAIDVGMTGDADIADMDEDGNTTEQYPFHMGVGPRVTDLANAPISAPSTVPTIDLGAYEAQPPALSVTKITGGGSLYEGTSFPVTITVSNTGLGTATDVVVTDTLPAGMTMVAGSLTRSMGDAGTLPVLAQNFDLAPAVSMTVNFQASVADGPVSPTNTAQVTAYEVPTAVEGSVVATINNLPPANINVTIPAGIIYEGSSSAYSGSYTDPAGSLDAPFAAQWSFGDGTAPVSGTFSQSHVYADSGIFNIVLNVCDADGAANNGCANSAPTPVTITNVAPVVSLNPVASGTNEGAAVNFSGGFTDVAEGLDAPYSYTWTLDATNQFAEGTVSTYISGATQVLNTSVAMGSGNHTVTLRVTDLDGDSRSVTSNTFNVANVLPAATISATGSPVEGTSFTFDAHVTDPGSNYGETYTFTWNFGDGSGPQSGGISQAHTFADSGSYTVTVTVTDSDGGVSDPASYLVTVGNVAPTAVINPVVGAIEGTAINFTGTFTDPAQGNDVSYTYQWMLDGATPIGSGTVASYVPISGPTVSASRAMGAGPHSVTLQVTDADGLASPLATANFVVTNVAPDPAISTSGTAVEGLSFGFTGTINDPGQPYGETYSYSWNFGDGSAPATGTLTPTHTYADSGSYDVVLTITDSHTGVGVSDAYRVVVSNVAPTPAINAITGVVEGTEYTFTGSFTDPAGALDVPYTYAWLLDGSQIGSGTVNSYPAPVLSVAADMLAGAHSIALRVTDADGGTTTVTSNFPAANVNPVVTIAAVGNIYDGIAASYSVSYVDPGTAYAETYTIRWDFGDGTIIPNGGLTQNHTYATQGEHTITVTVTDGHTGVGSDTLTFTVLNAAPVATLGAITGDRLEGSLLTFHVSAVDPSPTGSIASFSWNFGDGQSGSGIQPTHAYRDNGTYTVTVTATDNNGGTDVETTTITIDNVAPVVDAGNPAYAKVAQPMQFLGSVTDAGLDDTLATMTIVWDFGDGTTATGVLNPTHTYAIKGVYVVTLTVTDKDGGSDSDTTSGNVEQFKFFMPILGGGNP